jgi:hypothetical protein
MCQFYCNYNYSFWDKNTRHYFCTAPGMFMKHASPNPNTVSKIMNRNVPYVGRLLGKAEDALFYLSCSCCYACGPLPHLQHVAARS